MNSYLDYQAHTDRGRPASSRVPDHNPHPPVVVKTFPRKLCPPACSEPRPLKSGLRHSWQTRNQRTRTPTSVMAKCARAHPLDLMVGRNQTCAWISCKSCDTSSSWRTMEMDFLDYRSLCDLQGGELLRYHHALRTVEASRCVVCAAATPGHRGQPGIPVTWCTKCAARLCLNPACTHQHNDHYHPLPERRGIDLCVRDNWAGTRPTRDNTETC